MTLSFEQAGALIGSFIWPFTRIAAMLMAAPIFGARNVVFTIHRLGLAVALTIVIYPSLPAPPVFDPLSTNGLLMLINQLIIGFAMGFILQMVFASLIIAGHNISMTMGLGFAQFVDPANGLSVPVLSKFYLIIGTLLFFAFDGHLMAIETVIASFKALPVGVEFANPKDYFGIVLWGGRMYVGALLIALPCMVTLTLINIGFGVMTRAAPTMNIFAVGFPTTLFFGVVIIMLTLPNVLPRFHALLMESFDLMQAFVTRV